MTRYRKVLGAAAFSLALAGGGVAGAMLGVPALSSAQDSTEATTTTTASTSASSATPDHAGPGRFGHRGEGLAVAAEALGMTEDELKTELRAGKSIAQVAEAQGVDVQTVIDALVADGKERLADLEASLPDRVTELVNRTGWGDGDRGGRGHHARIRMMGLETAAEVIGISADDLRTALQDGSSVAEVAEANNVDVQKVIDALVADATARIDQAVANGRIDSARADEMKANLVERITAHVNGEDPGPPEGGFGDGPVD